ncbi:TlpA family protein disulfide reductase [Clostridium perfringens]|uniref:TlpA family protein disulfide reductase n=1 Tax=Clostridium perfringens TaxID=1502 RepID=UPI0039EB6541
MKNKYFKKIIVIILVLATILTFCTSLFFSLMRKDIPVKIDYKNNTVEEIVAKYNEKGQKTIENWFKDDEKQKNFALKYIGMKFPTINYKSVSGKEINNEIFKGNKTLIVIGASYCENCEATTAELEGLYKDVNVIEIFPKDDLSKIKTYYEKLKLPMPNDRVVVGDENKDMQIVKDLNIKAIPVLLYINEEGIITYAKLGSSDKKELNIYKDRAFSNTQLYKELKTEKKFMF